MKIRSLLLLALSVIALAAYAAEPAPAAASVATELRALVEKARAKLEAGSTTEAALSEEIKGFDALLAAHKGEATDEMAEVLFMKAALYLQALGETEKGAQLLRQVKTDFPGTKPARVVDQVLGQLEQQRESQRLQAALQPGAIFPDFDEKDLGGAPLSISRFKGKVVLVDFWATWCGPCVAELPNVIAAYQKYHAEGFEVIGISLDRSEDTLKKFLTDRGMTWPQYFDGLAWESKLGRRYGVSSIPATYLLDQEGRIVARDLRGPALETELARLLKK